MTLAFITASGTWAVPADVYLLEWVDCIGAGSNGAAFGTGGAGGAYVRKNALSVTPGDVFQVVAGAGQHSIFGGTVLTLCVCGAEKATGSVGGKAANSVGDIKYDGGNGNTTFGGAGGAGGPGGAGANGTSYAGGSGGGGGGGAGVPANFNGNDGTEYDATHGSGGGAGGRNASGDGRTGGDYGGGGGGHISGGTNGQGAPGLIVISYTTSTTVVLTAAQGSYTQAAVGTGLVSNSILPAALTFYNLTGSSADFPGLGFQCDQGAYVLTGEAADFVSPSIFPCSPGVYNLTGRATTLLPAEPATQVFYVAQNSRIFNVVGGS